jgi:hypothetical protein
MGKGVATRDVLMMGIGGFNEKLTYFDDLFALMRLIMLLVM